MHRFLPTLLRMNNYKVAEVPVSHSPRIYGKTKYGIANRLFKGLADLLVIRWMKKNRLNYQIEQIIQNQ
jgi:hypothetical protein